MTPTPRQAEFLALTEDEALFGGAAGGGKSEALLLWLAQGVDYPDYAGIVFRRTYAQITKSNEGLLAKSYRIYDPMGATWNATEKRWTFPSGAVIEFGHLPFVHSIYDYQGPSYIRVCFDELTQFSEVQYLYLKSRIRHAPGYPVTPGMRAASNPGGAGHAWVKRRFVTAEAVRVLAGLTSSDESEQGSIFRSRIDTSEGPVSVAFVPSRLADNPYVDFASYARNLASLDPITRERLLNGDWSITEDSPIRGQWLRYYSTRGTTLVSLEEDREVATIDSRQCKRFATIDTAGTSRDKAEEARGGSPAWSACLVWDFDRRADRLFLRDVWRARAGWGDLKAGVRATLDRWSVRHVRIENAHVGPPLAEELGKDREVRLVGPVLRGMTEGHRGAKLDRAIASGLIARVEAGKLLLPADANDWIAEYEDELTSWSGGPDEVCDQIDASSYGAWEAKNALQTWGGTIDTRGIRRGKTF